MVGLGVVDRVLAEGAIVRSSTVIALATQVPYRALPLATLQGFHAGIGNEVFEVLSLQGSLNARQVLGGTAPQQVR